MPSFPVETRPRIKRLSAPLEEFTAAEASGGVLLLAATAVALVWANSGWSESYHELWHLPVTVGVGELAISKSLLHWINDGLMAIFFFYVGLEIKRELLIGELATPRQAALPIAAALGGMVVPAGIFVALNAGTPEIRGWGVPMATDIAFALGILALLGSRVPVSLKIFLTAAAIVDDLGAVLVIALFYTADLSLEALGVAGGLVVVLLLTNFLGVRRTSVYVILGIALWVAVLKSGVHATIAGVALAMAIPARLRLEPGDFVAKVSGAVESFRNALPKTGVEAIGERLSALHVIEEACEQVETPLMRLEHALTGWVAFVIMPLFALANAGVDVRTGVLDALVSRPALGIALGLVLGKPIGFMAFTWGAERLGIGSLPQGTGWSQILGLGLVAGVGFTMALFIAGLAFGDGEMLNVAKSGIMAGSLVSGIAGYIWLARSRPGP